MKPARVKAEKERIARIRLRKIARQIPDNESFVTILLQMPNKPFRREFYARIRRYLKFEPVALEALDYEHES